MNKPPGHDRDLDAALLAAVVAGDTLRASALLEDGAWPNAQVTKELGEVWWSETPALYIACDKKFEDIVELLLVHGANPNSYLNRYENMQAATIPALIAAFPSVRIVERMLKAGADPNKGHWRREDAGWEQSPLRLAPTEEIKDLLRRYGAAE